MSMSTCTDCHQQINLIGGDWTDPDGCTNCLANLTGIYAPHRPAQARGEKGRRVMAQPKHEAPPVDLDQALTTAQAAIAFVLENYAEFDAWMIRHFGYAPVIASDVQQYGIFIGTLVDESRLPE